MNTIIRQYNYRLETGIAKTDDENVANILYNINRMEMKASFTSSNEEVSDKALGELFFMITDAKVHLNRFLKIFGSKTDADTVDTVVAALNEAMQMVRVARQETDTAKMVPIFPTVYKKLLDIVPFVLALDAQAGRI